MRAAATVNGWPTITRQSDHWLGFFGQSTRQCCRTREWRAGVLHAKNWLAMLRRGQGQVRRSSLGQPGNIYPAGHDIDTWEIRASRLGKLNRATACGRLSLQFSKILSDLGRLGCKSKMWVFLWYVSYIFILLSLFINYLFYLNGGEGGSLGRRHGGSIRARRQQATSPGHSTLARPMQVISGSNS